MARVWWKIAAGWAGIVALAWWLADSRMRFCYSGAECLRSMLAVRDGVLTGGLTVALVVAGAAGLVAAYRNERLNGPGRGRSSTSQAERSKRLP